MPKPYSVSPFLTDLLHARSPSGYEFEAQKVFDQHVKPAADKYHKDAMGNRLAILNPDGDPVLMFAGHMDELGLIVSFVNKDGFLYFDTIGGHDRIMIPGRRVIIQTANGPVKGVTGKRAIHLMDEADRKKVPETHEIWIDIGEEDPWYARALQLHGNLLERGVEHEWHAWPGGHDGDYWTEHVPDYLRFYSQALTWR